MEQAAVAYDWRRFWARANQVPPEIPWRSWGLCTGRSFGKTRACAEYVHAEAMLGRAPRICLIAQDEQEAIDDMINGDSGIISIAPPWEVPVLTGSGGSYRLLWPNGAQGFVKTPHQPGKIRGPGFHLVWASELVAWPHMRRDEAVSNLRRTNRLGYARFIWDTTPKRQHPIIRELLDRHSRSPQKHLCVRGSSRANVANINADALDEWEQELGGTLRGREELDGEYVDDIDTALVRFEWIEKNRADEPDIFDRRVIAVDPALSTRRSTDATGIVEAGVRGGRYYVIHDYSARMPWELWGETVIALAFENRIDCVIVERNAGFDAVTANLRVSARNRCQSTGERITIQLVSLGARVRREPGVVYVKEALAQRSKQLRAEPVAALYERGLVSHCNGADLSELEEQWTTWDPESPRSPNNLDACVWALWELAGLASDEPQRNASMDGLGLMRAKLRPSARVGVTVGAMLRPPGRRSSMI